jgi:hypothetical protein
VDETKAREFLLTFLDRLGRMTAMATERPPSMPSCLPIPAKVDIYLPADAGRTGTLLVVLAGHRRELEPSRWRVRHLRGELFRAALGLDLPGRWPPRGGAVKNIQLIDMVPVDERLSTSMTLLVDGCRFAERAARPGFRRPREKEIEWAHLWLRVPDRYFTPESAIAQADACFAFYRRLPSIVAADGAGQAASVRAVRADLEDLLIAYRTMLENPSTTEAQLQLFLKQHPEFFGIYPWMREEFVIPDPVSGHKKYVADFLFRRPEGDYEFYEIEKSADTLLRGSGDLTAKANHALEQVENWLELLEGSAETTTRMLPGFASPRGFAVVGLRRSIDPDEVTRLRRRDRHGGRVTLLFFDDLADRMAAFIDSLPG